MTWKTRRSKEPREDLDNDSIADETDQDKSLQKASDTFDTTSKTKHDEGDSDSSLQPEKGKNRVPIAKS